MIQACYAEKGTLLEKWRKRVGDSPCFAFLVRSRMRRIICSEEHIIVYEVRFVCLDTSDMLGAADL